MLQLLDPLQDPSHQRIPLLYVGQKSPQLADDRRTARLVRDQEPPLVTHPLRLDVLKRVGDLHHSIDMCSALVGECALTDIRLAVVVIDVGDLAEEAGEVHQFREVFAAHCLETHLQLEVGQN